MTFRAVQVRVRALSVEQILTRLESRLLRAPGGGQSRRGAAGADPAGSDHLELRHVLRAGTKGVGPGVGVPRELRPRRRRVRLFPCGDRRLGHAGTGGRAGGEIHLRPDRPRNGGAVPDDGDHSSVWTATARGSRPGSDGVGPAPGLLRSADQAGTAGAAGGEALGERMFTVLFDEGAQLTSDEAIAYAPSHDR
jgi:hypothetical protein